MINQFNFDDNILRGFIEYSTKSTTLSPWHITRFSMYRSLENLLTPHDDSNALAALISHSHQLASVTGIRQARFVEMNYPEFNILSLPIADCSFDFAFADMIFEHIEGNPWEAYREIDRILKPGGFLVLTTVFSFPYHPCPGDFWRYTESGLRMIATQNQHEVIHSGCWGNLQAFILDRLGCADLKVPVDPEHPLHKLAIYTDPNWPVVTWLVARKH